MTIMDLQKLVDQALDQALENDYDLSEFDATYVACDLMDCDSSFEQADYKSIVGCCEDWLKRKRSGVEFEAMKKLGDIK